MGCRQEIHIGIFSFGAWWLLHRVCGCGVRRLWLGECVYEVGRMVLGAGKVARRGLELAGFVNSVFFYPDVICLHIYEITINIPRIENALQCFAFKYSGLASN
jgi:hypothetical protein